MTILEAIHRTDDLKPNIYDQATKIFWLSRLDAAITEQIHNRYQQPRAFPGYGPDTPGDTPLLVGAPYDEIYQRWLEAQMDLSNGEMDRYNGSVVLFNSLWDSYAAAYGRSHMPLSRGPRFVF